MGVIQDAFDAAFPDAVPKVPADARALGGVIEAEFRRRPPDQYVTPEMFDIPEHAMDAEYEPGVTVDGSAAIRAAIAIASSFGKVVRFTAGRTYWCKGYGDELITVPSGTVIEGYGATLRVLPTDFTGVYSALSWEEDADRWAIYGLTLIGDRDFHDPAKAGEWGFGLAFYGATNGTIQDVWAEGFWGDGIYFGYAGAQEDPRRCENINVVRSTMKRNRRQGCSIIVAHELHFLGCDFLDTQGTAPGAGVDIEPNAPVAQNERMGRVTFTLCRFKGNAGGWLLWFAGQVLCDKIEVEDNGGVQVVMGRGRNMDGLDSDHFHFLKVKNGYFRTTAAHIAHFYTDRAYGPITYEDCHFAWGGVSGSSSAYTQVTPKLSPVRFRRSRFDVPGSWTHLLRNTPNVLIDDCDVTVDVSTTSFSSSPANYGAVVICGIRNTRFTYPLQIQGSFSHLTVRGDPGRLMAVKQIYSSNVGPNTLCYLKVRGGAQYGLRSGGGTVCEYNDVADIESDGSTRWHIYVSGDENRVRGNKVHEDAGAAAPANGITVGGAHSITTENIVRLPFATATARITTTAGSVEANNISVDTTPVP